MLREAKTAVLSDRYCTHRFLPFSGGHEAIGHIAHIGRITHIGRIGLWSYMRMTFGVKPLRHIAFTRISLRRQSRCPVFSDMPKKRGRFLHYRRRRSGGHVSFFQRSAVREIVVWPGFSFSDKNRFGLFRIVFSRAAELTPRG